MRLIVSEPAAALIDERGGRLYVWLRRRRCCGGVMTLATASDPPPRKQFRRVESTERFELYVPAALTRLPDELDLDVRRFPLRVEAYWNGCVWVT